MATAIGMHKSGRCCSCRFDGQCLFSHLQPEDLSDWQGILMPKSYRKNDIVFWEEEEAAGLYLVCSGVIKLIKSSTEGHQQIVRFVGPGNFCGLPPLISHRTHFCTAQALEHSEIHFIPRESFLRFLERFPNFAFRIIDQLAHQLSMARLRLRDFGYKTGRQRVADLLLDLGREFGINGEKGVEIGINISRADLAGMAGLTTETTIRLLSAFRKEGLLETCRMKRIILLDQEHLQVISGGEDSVDCCLAGPI